ncbi:hypothetical protein GCM10010361_18210 [Streptomyces olivaceiscleroticus]|uniref:HTH luxR-type domain-containing protein n=1 Tax=Streptomyces olivaceiscleroticus TaxID=68245 RepID=A0ABP3JI91_9ACTN
MKQHRRIGYGPDADPVGQHAGEDLLGRELRRLLTSAERKLLLDHLHGVPLDQLARHNGLTVESVKTLISHLLHRLRTSEHADQLRQELRDRHGPRHSREVWQAAEELPVHWCAAPGCTAQPFTQAAVGRPKKFCSDRCRVAMHRARKRAAEGKLHPMRNARPTQPPKQQRRYRWQDYSAPLPELPAPRSVSAPAAEFLQRHLLYGRRPPVERPETPATFRGTQASRPWSISTDKSSVYPASPSIVVRSHGIGRFGIGLSLVARQGSERARGSAELDGLTNIMERLREPWVPVEPTLTSPLHRPQARCEQWPSLPMPVLPAGARPWKVEAPLPCGPAPSRCSIGRSLLPPLVRRPRRRNRARRAARR